MLTLVPIGVITVVLGFIIGVLGGFPVQGGTIDSTSQTFEVDQFSKEIADEAGRRFGSAYTSVIDDLISYMDDPDLQRADDQREAMVEYATLIIPQFQDFAQSLQGKLDELIGSAETETSF